MSLLDTTILITGFVTITTAICLVIWLFYDLSKTLFERPRFIDILIFIIVFCFYTFIGCLAYLAYIEKDTKDYQQYLELKAKFEKE